MKRVWLVLVMVSLLTGCTSTQASKEVDSSRQVQSPAPTVTAPIEPVVRLEKGRVLLPEGLSGRIPQDAYAVGATLLLQGIEEEVANISFEECPKGVPDRGCIHNHRAMKSEGSASVADMVAKRFEAEYQKPSTAADNRTWLEIHTIVPLPSGRRIDVVGQVLSGSGQEVLLRSVYESLLSSFSKS